MHTRWKRMLQERPVARGRSRHRVPSLRRSLVALLMACAGLAHTPCPAAADEPYGRACLVVEERSGNEPQDVVTSVFDDGSTPGSGKRLALYADASVDAYVLVAAFNDQDRRLTNGWRPQLVEMKAWEERHLPLAPATWEWTGPVEPFEVYVVFLTRTAEGLDTLQRLVAALQKPTADAALLDLQANKLREELARGMVGQPPLVVHAGAVSSAWGGTLRGEPFPWPKQAQKAVCDAKGRGALLFRHGPS